MQRFEQAIRILRPSGADADAVRKVRSIVETDEHAEAAEIRSEANASRTT